MDGGSGVVSGLAVDVEGATAVVLRGGALVFSLLVRRALLLAVVLSTPLLAFEDLEDVSWFFSLLHRNKHGFRHNDA